MTAIQLFKSDLQAAKKYEPSTQADWIQWLELCCCSAGLQAILLHRFAHFFYRLNLPFVPRLISHLNRFLTGVEIHPGARIGNCVTIRGGMGVVIGETAIVGDGAILYEGVTLGGTGMEQGKRHPTLGQNVVIESGATVLGNIVIGEGSVIGSGAVVFKDIPAKSRVVGIPGQAIAEMTIGDRNEATDFESQLIQVLLARTKALEAEISRLKSETPNTCPEITKPYIDVVESDRLIEGFCDGLGI